MFLINDQFLRKEKSIFSLDWRERGVSRHETTKKTNAILQQNKSFDLFNRQQYKTNTIVCYKNFFLYKTNKKTLEN